MQWNCASKSCRSKQKGFLPLEYNNCNICKAWENSWYPYERVLVQEPEMVYQIWYIWLDTFSWIIAQIVPVSFQTSITHIPWQVTLIARFMETTWGPSGADRTQVAPCWPHELCYLERYSEVHASVVTEWPPACLHKLLRRGHQTATLKNPQMEEVPNSINICPTNPIQVLNLHGFF